ncbi:glucose 1-dehydrogenase [Pseudohaliea sp.]|uniref:glucose 1-dehydrogenase n=1 Tax=Pseudohaliea sp. TaxID=2740289 RepID=UPI0032ED113A
MSGEQRAGCERLRGRVAVITGGASGIGEATTRRFAAEGCRVVIGDVQEARGLALVETLGPAAQFQRCDVTDPAQVEALVARAVDSHGRLDVMFNNAGIVGCKGPVDELLPEEWKATLDVLLNGVFYGMKYAAAVMKPQGFGSIISMSSVAGISGGLGPTAYTAAKHAVIGLTKSMAAELGAFGIRVNAIAPYAMVTPMVSDVYFEDPEAIDATRDLLARGSPLKNRAGTADDVANAALWLASDESGYTSGHTLTTDAGFTAGARSEPPRFAERKPMQREGGKAGLPSTDD